MELLARFRTRSYRRYVITAEVLFALAEICYLLGRDAERHENSEACAFYYHCAGYAYHFLFDQPPGNDLGLQPVPQKGAPALVGAGMMGDRADVIFAGPEEITGFISQQC